ncbi:unnamed protein product, partial [Trichogramma brassicae]
MSSPSAGKRRMDTDVIKLIESKHEVTILGGLNEFSVKFYGPRGIARCFRTSLRSRSEREEQSSALNKKKIIILFGRDGTNSSFLVVETSALSRKERNRYSSSRASVDERRSKM